jgi:hypothetical protein
MRIRVFRTGDRRRLLAATTSPESAETANPTFGLRPIVDGRPPYPLTVRQGVPQLYLAKAQAGGVLQAKVDPADPTAVFLDFARS